MIRFYHTGQLKSNVRFVLSCGNCILYYLRNLFTAEAVFDFKNSITFFYGLNSTFGISSFHNKPPKIVLLIGLHLFIKSTANLFGVPPFVQD